MGGNPFYTNAEAYAFEILQQKLIKEAQKSAQQTVMELSALKTLFNQGQFIYCIPFGGAGFQGHIPFPFYPPSEPVVSPPEQHHHCLTHPPPPPPSNNQCSPVPPSRPLPNQSVVHVNVKNGPTKVDIAKPGIDECNLGEVGIDVTIDLREYLPAEITLNVEEKSVEIKAYHFDSQASKTFVRKYDLPACIILDSVKCILTHDGYLLFSAAWIKME